MISGRSWRSNNGAGAPGLNRSFSSLCSRLRRERLNIRNNLQYPFFADRKFKNRHDRLISLDDLGARLKYRFADIIFVRRNGFSTLERYGLAHQSHQRWAAPRISGQMARRAAERLEKFFSRCSRGSARAAAADPSRISGWFHDDNPPHHPGMLRAAILRAKQVIGSRLARFEP